MRKPILLRKPFTLVSLAIVLSLLITTTVYACSGLGLMQMNTQHSSMDGEGVKRGPCAEHKQDICKSVRERMLSIQPAAFKAPDAGSLLYCPTPLVLQSFENVGLLPQPFGVAIVYHPVFKLSLSFSYLVLRI
jgi:hypothetical protein